MEAFISAFCRSLAVFCNHVQSSSQALSDSIHRRPIPLDSAASTFLQSLDRRISSTADDLNLLESMALGTVSFEELLGHCNEIYKINQRYISDLQERMISFGYVPEIGMDDEDDELPCLDSKFLSPISGLDRKEFSCGSVSILRSNRKRLDEDQLFEDSISLQNLGLSDAALATLASEDQDNLASHSTSMTDTMSRISGNMVSLHPLKDISNVSDLQKDDCKVAEDSSNNLIKTSKDDYDNLPAYMKSLASWQDLEDAVAKMNSYLSNKSRTIGNGALNQDDLEFLGLGRKGRSFLLLLLRMNQLVVENVDGSVLYRVRAPC
ncbi:uncharacterized protein LOC120277874 [Dioscorea cayenensis subsp. rotundata]|uniref:Uncharacterized protein LOC120277874 n=1 Tax=Dioscorea cayennensis subsp. rotundata TaxID=55577 RepID=A0AB40CPD5_DIOCR|nr:uncharacterized protein LOC120277874 [Dioscorea cayenensis subsp. rotundata]